MTTISSGAVAGNECVPLFPVWGYNLPTEIEELAMPDELPSQETLRALAERIHRGDPAAEDELARVFNQRVFVMLVARTHDPEAARELTQDVLVAVLRALRDGQLREAERLTGFVHGTARNLVNNYFRTQSREPKAEPLSSDLPAAEPTAELEAAEQSRLVHLAVERLDLIDRKILLMTLVEGYKPGEIATQLGLSCEVVRQRKSRAVRKVTEYLGKMSRK